VSDASFNLAIQDISKNNQCYDSINQQLFSNPQYYTTDSCNNLILTDSGNALYQKLIQQNPQCVDIQPSTMNTAELISQYEKMNRRRREIDQNMNMILNMDSRSNIQPEIFQHTNRNYSVSIMFVVLAISMVYYTSQHLQN
jgi:hypothetical protein